MISNRRGFIAGFVATFGALVTPTSALPVVRPKPDCGPDSAHQSGYQIIITPAPCVFHVGDVITIGGVTGVNRRTKRNTGRLRQFVVTAETPIGGIVLSIYPPIIPVGHDPDGWCATVQNCAAKWAPITIVDGARIQVLS